jgi:hypothetical protein
MLPARVRELGERQVRLSEPVGGRRRLDRDGVIGARHGEVPRVRPGDRGGGPGGRRFPSHRAPAWPSLSGHWPGWPGPFYVGSAHCPGRRDDDRVRAVGRAGLVLVVRRDQPGVSERRQPRRPPTVTREPPAGELLGRFGKQSPHAACRPADRAAAAFTYSSQSFAPARTSWQSGQ